MTVRLADVGGTVFLCVLSVFLTYYDTRTYLFLFVFFSSSYILSVELFAMFTWDLAVLELSWLGSENNFSIQVLRVS